MTEINQQAQHIIGDVIFKTFTSHNRLFLLLYNVNLKLIEKIKQEPEKLLFKNIYHYLNFNHYFSNNNSDSKILKSEKDFKLSFFDKRDLKSAFKKAIKMHEWELNKMKQEDSSKILDVSWKYVETFIEIIDYLIQFSKKSKT